MFLRFKSSIPALASALAVTRRLSTLASIRSHRSVLQVIVLSSVGIMNFHCQRPAQMTYKGTRGKTRYRFVEKRKELERREGDLEKKAGPSQEVQMQRVF